MHWVMEKGNWYQDLLNRYKAELRFVSAELQTVEQVVGEGPFIATVKYNGELTAGVMTPDCAATYNRYGRVRWDFPALTDFLDLANADGIRAMIALGELYAVSPEGRPLPLNQTMSIIKKPRTPEQEEQIRFAVFDIYSIANEVLYGRSTYADRFLLIHEIFGRGHYAHAAAGRDFETGSPVVQDLWDRHVLDENYEGLVIRANRAVKIKPKFSVDVAIVGIFRGKGRLENTLGGFVTAFMDPNGDFYYAGRVGTGLDDAERDAFWAELEPQVIGPGRGSRSDFGQGGNLMVPPTTVIEVIAGDFVNRDVDRLAWDDGRYELIDEGLGWTLQQPRFIRIRDDKGIIPDDLRLEQVPIVAQ